MKILGIQIPNFLSHKKEKYTVFYPRININLKGAKQWKEQESTQVKKMH